MPTPKCAIYELEMKGNQLWAFVTVVVKTSPSFSMRLYSQQLINNRPVSPIPGLN